MEGMELTSFRSLLQNKLEQISRQEATSVRDIFENYAPCPDTTDWATMESDRDINLIMRERNLKSVTEIIEALRRLEDGTYGVCDECGEDIGIPRLRAKPMATLCVSCQGYFEKGPSSSY